MLTAADVEQKTFSTALRGYDLDEVDDFLDEIVATIKDLNEKLEEAQSASTAVAPAPVPESTEEAPAPAADRLSELGLDESAVGRALVAAQAAADRLLEDAQSEASKILDDAKDEADTWEAERQAKKAEAEAAMAALADRVGSVRSELAVLAAEVSDKLNDMDEVISSGVADDDTDVDTEDDEPGEANRVTLIETSEESGSDTAETGSEATDTAHGGDHLDQILTGVASELQLNDEDSEPDVGDSDEEFEAEGLDDGEDEDRDA